ncbi:sugar transferase [Paraburkholderia acidipaludis]|uniref:sugar transferase n=1 Tax=Paraburkholderia acidipaludis TaxID=660537 RepID=UPI000485752F|nr:sugar transferase [Paraburkholderia acidipaludis]
MSELAHRAIDIALIVLGAFGALHLNLNLADVGRPHQFDPTLVAFVAALALSVFPACGTYPVRGSRSVMSIASRTTFAWLAVQLCGLALLYAIHREHLVLMPWFLYWTLTTGISLLASHTLFFAQFSVVHQAGGWLNRTRAPAELPEGALHAVTLRRLVKRGFDIVVCLILIAALLPVLLALALIVKSDGGPALYGHTRVGRHGRKFRCLKFRSMVVNSEAVLKELLASDPAARAEWEREFKLKHDVRVTRIGRFLRRTSLDELPQLWNVLRGEMSLVGPRPIVDQELERYGVDRSYYLMATPGITGLWQVSGRCDTDYATRVSLDVSYVKNWSLHRDIGILFKTFVVVIRGNGAY